MAKKAKGGGRSGEGGAPPAARGSTPIPVAIAAWSPENQSLADRANDDAWRVADGVSVGRVRAAAAARFGIALPPADAREAWADRCRAVDLEWEPVGDGEAGRDAAAEAAAAWIERHTGRRPDPVWETAAGTTTAPARDVPGLLARVRAAKAAVPIGAEFKGKALDGASVYNVLMFVEGVLAGRIDPLDPGPTTAPAAGADGRA